MKIGFTGTRYGCTPAQLAALEVVVLGFFEVEEQSHHGDCVGADAQFDALCASHGYLRAAHPAFALGHALRAGCAAETILPLKPPLDRNHDIVDASDVMVACPGEEMEQRRSGTWATIRYARKQRRQLAIVYPSGLVVWERDERAPG